VISTVVRHEALAEVQAERLTAERALDEAAPPKKQLTANEVRAPAGSADGLVERLDGAVDRLAPPACGLITGRGSASAHVPDPSTAASMPIS
jgi:hypothetical protein